MSTGGSCFTVEDTAKLIFAGDDTSYSSVTVNIGDRSFHDAHERFVVYADLLRRGLAIMFGTDEGVVPLDALTARDFERVRMRLLRRANVGMTVDISPLPETERGSGRVSMSHMPLADADLGELRNHVLVINTNQLRIIIGFSAP